VSVANNCQIYKEALRNDKIDVSALDAAPKLNIIFFSVLDAAAGSVPDEEPPQRQVQRVPERRRIRRQLRVVQGALQERRQHAQSSALSSSNFGIFIFNIEFHENFTHMMQNLYKR
jgi:hypothetical protein